MSSSTAADFSALFTHPSGNIELDGCRTQGQTVEPLTNGDYKKMLSFNLDPSDRVDRWPSYVAFELASSLQPRIFRQRLRAVLEITAGDISRGSAAKPNQMITAPFLVKTTMFRVSILLTWKFTRGPSCTNRSPLQQTCTAFSVGDYKNDVVSTMLHGDCLLFFFFLQWGGFNNSNSQSNKHTPVSLGVFTTLPCKTWAASFI